MMFFLIGSLETPKVLLNPLLSCILVTISIDLVFQLCILIFCMHNAGDQFIQFFKGLNYICLECLARLDMYKVGFLEDAIFDKYCVECVIKYLYHPRIFKT